MKLTLKNISKTYKNGVKALDALSCEITAGMTGLLGPNGAGKSTLMRTLATLQKPDSGDIFFNEIDILKDPLSLRKQLGYLPQEFGVYPKMTAEELLGYFAALKGIPSGKAKDDLIHYVLELTNLYDVRKKYVDGYSGGMKQRFGIAQLLLSGPKLIIVDEPTAGLDPAERNRFLNILREIARTNIIIFSTHIVEDIKDLCNDMAIMNNGRILKHVHPVDCIKELRGKIWTKNINPDRLEEAESAHEVLSSGYNRDDSVNIRVFSEHDPGEGFAIGQPALEDYYFAVLNGNLK
ncbi:MAG TPA: ABC transporter ATP-binding protein [Ignavibacteria bacterium]|nr:ABC transporter ATP-binding protein [Ignavibacteria bacterium]HMQ97652.1 ABC transporter ATP-binding protein [Ignavibacteria bacterium]